MKQIYLILGQNALGNYFVDKEDEEFPDYYEEE